MGRCFPAKDGAGGGKLSVLCDDLCAGMGAIAYAGGYMTMINNFQREFNAEVMEVSSMITLGGSEEEGTDMVDQMRITCF